MVACWPLVPKFEDSNPAEAVGFFRAKKSSFGREVKPFVPFRSFRSKLPAISRPSSSSFHYYGLWWRHLEVQIGMTKDQGSVQ